VSATRRIELQQSGSNVFGRHHGFRNLLLAFAQVILLMLAFLIRLLSSLTICESANCLIAITLKPERMQEMRIVGVPWQLSQ
jgi:hypothetical protein